MTGMGGNPERSIGVLQALFDTQNAAPVIITDLDGERGSWNSSWERQEKFSPLFKRPRNYEGDRRLVYMHDDEARFMAKMLLEPSKDPQKILQRQIALQALASTPSLDELITLKNQAYRTHAGAMDLLCYYGTDPQYWKAHEERLISVYHQGITELPDYDDFGFGEVGKKEVKPLMEEGVAKIGDGIVAFERFAAKLGKVPADALAGVTSEVASVLQETKRELDKDVLLTISSEPEQPWYFEKYRWDKLVDFTNKTLKATLLRLGALLEFADIVRRDSWSPVTFDPTKPDFYLAGWNIEGRKGLQVRNNSPEGLPIIIYSGANTSGKSFGMKADFLLRLSAQALGLAPADAANLRLHQAFAYLDRASTIHEQDLSAFMSEVKNWNEVLPLLGANTRLYVDEGFSTTSPDDQARLLLATAKYIAQEGGSMVLASHNENLLRRSSGQINIGVYHLRSDVDQSGRLERYFTLTPGSDDSKAIAVARARGFHTNVIETAERYLRGEQTIPAPERAIHFPEITAYTPEQRDQMKLELKSLVQLIPESPTDPILRLYSTDNDFRPGNFLRHQTGIEDSVGSIKAIFAKMILFAPALSSEQTLERQQMFAELITDARFEQISELARRLRVADQSMAIIANSQAEGINRALYPLAINPDRKPDQKIKLEQRDIKALVAFLSLNAKVLGNRFEYSELIDRLIGLKKVEDAHALLTELEGVYDVLPVIKFQEIPLSAIQDELDALLAYRQKDKDTTEKVSNTLQRRKQRHPDTMDDLAEMLNIAMGGLPRALKEYPVYQEDIAELVRLLKATDSVYLHQTVNTAESLFASMVDQVIAEQTQDPAVDLTADMGLFSFSMLGRRIDSPFQGLPNTEPQKSPFGKELALLDALCVGASIIDAQKFSPVRFNSTGEVSLVNGFNLLKAKGVQVANSTLLGGENSKLHVLTGPNGSGKTFYEKGTVTAVLAGLATGYAPADEVTMPLFDSVVYLDRVTEKVGRDLSAFANELVFWDELVATLKDKNAVFAAVDEAFSTTSPLYQSALTYAVVGEFRRRNHYLLLSTHNHEVVDELAVSDGGSIEPYHFLFDAEKDTVTYEFRLQKGHRGSHAVEVAKGLGLKEEIVESARII